MKINKFHYHEEGIHRFLGSLEAKIMEVMWSKDKLSIKQVHEILIQDTPLSFNSVMTVMNRLCDKNLLQKKSTGGGRTKVTHFTAVCSKQEFLQEQTKTVTAGLIKEYGDLVVTHMVDAMEEADPNLIEKLAQKLEEMKRKH